MRKFAAAVLILLLSDSGIRAQQELDSLYQTLGTAKSAHDSCVIYESIVFGWISVDLQKGFESAEAFLHIARRSSEKKDLANALNARGNVCNSMRNYRQAITDMAESLNILKELNDSSSISVAYTNLANVMNALSNHSASMEYLLEAEKHLVPTTTASQRAHLNSQLAICNRNLKQYDKAVTYFRLSIESFELVGDSLRADRIRMSYGILLTMMEKFEAADSVFARLRSVYEADHNELELAMLEENAGNNFLGWKRFSDAESAYQKAESIWIKHQSNYDLAIIYNEFAECYRAWEKYKEAITYAKKSLALCEAMGIADYALKNHEVLATVYDKTGAITESLLHLKAANELEDSLQTDERNLLALSMQAKYESEKRQREIALLNAEKELDEIRASRQRLYTRLSIAGGCLLILLGLMLFNRIRTRQHIRELELRNKIANDLHDEVGSSLSSIRMLSEISMGTTDVVAARPLLEKISANSRDTVESISDIVWSINPRNDGRESMAQRMHQFLESACLAKGIKIEFEDHVLSQLRMDMRQRRNIYLVFKEAVNNAAKYASPEKITIRLESDGKNFSMLIRDNGTGFDPETASESGNGLRSMRARASELGGQIDIESFPDNGTSIHLLIPLTRFR
ncbi:MAG: tetratricopeptide repeat protein [Flavobacteriales bacterium]|nr:tetratricopeptide repeat protein [Flavobacteriales bacterium]